MDERYPMATFPWPDTLLFKAAIPTPTLNAPVVFFSRLVEPIAMLASPSLITSAPLPTATLLPPLLLFRAFIPTATLFDLVFVLKAPCPTAVFNPSLVVSSA